MKAMVLTADNQFVSSEVAQPRPAAGEVAIRVVYAGLQWGDVLVFKGHFPVPRPFVPGFEAAGWIISVGQGVDPQRVGQTVTALTSRGAFAEVVSASSLLTFDVGDLPLSSAAAFGWGGPTAYDLVHSVGRVRPGDRVLIHAAAGGVGILAAQFARQAGASRIVGVLRDPARLPSLERFGYARLVGRESFATELEGEQFDVILDPIGGATRTANSTLLAPHGRLAVYGNIATFESVLVSVNDLLMMGKSLLTYNSHLLSTTHPERLAESARLALAQIVRGEVTPYVGAEFELEQLASAVEQLVEGRSFGKSVVRVST